MIYLLIAIIVIALSADHLARFVPKKAPEHPGLLFMPDQPRDNASRLAEYERRRALVGSRVQQWVLTASDCTEAPEDAEYRWWLVAYTAHQQYLQRGLRGLGFCAKLRRRNTSARNTHLKAIP